MFWLIRNEIQSPLSTNVSCTDLISPLTDPSVGKLIGTAGLDLGDSSFGFMPV